MSEVRFMLPMPPSVNALYSTNWNTKRRFTSERYEVWKADAYEALLKTKPRPPPTPGKVVVAYMLGRPDKRRRDCSNALKACDDFLVAHSLIDDDSEIEFLSIGWTDDHPGQVEVIIKPFARSP